MPFLLHPVAPFQQLAPPAVKARTQFSDEAQRFGCENFRLPANDGSVDLYNDRGKPQLYQRFANSSAADDGLIFTVLDHPTDWADYAK